MPSPQSEKHPSSISRVGKPGIFSALVSLTLGTWAGVALQAVEKALACVHSEAFLPIAPRTGVFKREEILGILGSPPSDSGLCSQRELGGISAPVLVSRVAEPAPHLSGHPHPPVMGGR